MEFLKNLSFTQQCIMLSCMFCVAAVAVYAYAMLAKKYFSNKQIKAFAIILLFLSVVALRFSVNDLQIGSSEWERLINSIAHAIQSFGLAEDYSVYIERGSELLKTTGWADFYRIYAAALNVICPFAGGIFILSVLFDIFPSLKLMTSAVFCFKKIYYISELNERSLAFARSLVNENGRWRGLRIMRPYMVFAQVYRGGDKDRSSEYITTAKNNGFIFLDMDIAYIRTRHFGEKNIVLIDTLENTNLHKLSLFAEEKYNKNLKCRDRIYVFTQRAELFGIIKNRIEERKADAPLVIDINEYRNIALSVLREVPLYLPIVGNKNEIRVAVIGSGSIGTQFFLNSVWCGKMLEHRLSLTVISLEAQEGFEKRINYINPDILRCLREEGGYGYFQTDIAAFDFDNTDNFDYIFVALGSDVYNIEVSKKLEATYNRKGKNAAVVTIVYDEKLKNAVDFDEVLYHPLEGISNNACIYKNEGIAVSKRSKCTELYAAASFNSLYSYKNVFLMVAPDEAVFKTETEKGPAKMPLTDYWILSARYIHFPYKLFSLGVTDYEEYKRLLDEPEQKKRLKELERERDAAFKRAFCKKCCSDSAKELDCSLLEELDLLTGS